MTAVPYEFGALVVMIALLAKSDLFKDLLEPVNGVPGPYDPPGLLSFQEWLEKNPGGSDLEYQDYVLGV